MLGDRPGKPASKQVYLPTAEQIVGGGAEAQSLWSARDRMKRLRGRAGTGRMDGVPSRRNRRKHPDVVSGRHG